MATGSISSLGIGSGIDLNSLLNQLVTLERTPITQLQQRGASYTTKLSALGSLKSTLSNLQTAAKSIGTTTNFAAYKTNLADSAVATAAASGSAAAGSYSIEVTQLAEFQKVKSAGYAATTSNVATGTLKIEIGSSSGGGPFTADNTKTKNIVINGTNNTLAGVRDAINASGADVTASIVNDGSGTPYRLVLTGKNSGTANSFKLSGVAGLDYDPSNVAGSTLSKIQEGKDATVIIDTMTITKASNTITDAIEGVTLKLTKTNQNNPTTLSVTQDTAAMEDKVKSFVNAYNLVVNQIKSQSAYNADTKVAGPLNGDSAVRSIGSQLRAIVGSTLSGGSLTRLSEAGISIAVDGTLSLDSTKFQAALTDPTKNVAALFGTSNGVKGFAEQISSKITDLLSTDGLLTARTDGINKTIKDFDKRIEAMEKRVEQVEARYRRQFAALDTMVASFNSTSSFLTQQINKLNAQG